MLAEPPRKLRIVLWRSAFNGVPVAPECVAAVERAAALCRELGHEVVEGTPPDIEYDAFVQAHANVLAGNIVLSVDTRLGLTGQPLRDGDLEPVLRQGYDYGKTLPAAQYIGSVNRFHAIGRILDHYMEGYDAILSPSLTQLPLKLGELSTAEGSFLDFRRKVATYGTFSAAFNASGQPAASLPLVWTNGGLPVGVQVAGRYGREDVVLALSAQLEMAQPWAGRIAVPRPV